MRRVPLLAVGAFGLLLFLGVIGSFINDTRNSAGLKSLIEVSALSSFAQTHSNRMAQDQSIYHSTGLAEAAPAGWTKLGEIVGKGGSEASIFEAFLASDSHRNTLMGDFTHYGEGVAAANGIVYVTVVFAKYEVAATTTTEAVTTTVKPTTTRPLAPAPRPTITTTTTTTTTTQPERVLVVPDHIKICDESVWEICLE